MRFPLSFHGKLPLPLFSLLTWAGVGAFSPVAQAALHETYLLGQGPAESDLRTLSGVPGSRDYRVTVQNPDSRELDRIRRLPNASRIEVRAESYPAEREVPAWQAWAHSGSGETMFIATSYPTPQEVERLNRIGFAKLALSFVDFPTSVDCASLNRLQGEVKVFFNTGRYPQPPEQTPLLELSPHFEIEMIANQWPRYVHMDFLNRMPQKKGLTIRDIYPTDVALTYLVAIRDLGRLVVETDFDPYRADVWGKLSSFAVTWVRSGSLPSASQLQGWKEALDQGARFEKLVLRPGRALTAREQEALESSRLPVDLRVDFRDPAPDKSR